MAKISIIVPIHEGMKNGEYFLWRLTQSLMRQTFKDYELVIVQEGKMARNTNAGMRKASGELVKILYLDDYFAHDNALKEIVENFGEKDQWLVTGCLHQRTDERDFYEDPHSPHYPKYTQNIYTGNNCIGSPSVLTIRREGMLLFDEELSFFLDCDLYYRYFHQFGLPKYLNDLNVVIGLGDHQTSNIMPDAEKRSELGYMMEKYG